MKQVSKEIKVIILSEHIYAATELFQAGIPERVIQDRTGHRSLDGLRQYERISEKQKEAACKVLCVALKPTVEECVTGMHNSTSIQNCSCHIQQVILS